MPDQTPVTIDDRNAHEWAHANKGRANDSVARAIRAHVPAPRATLAAELRTASWGDIPALADRVEAVEKENRAALNHAYDERDEALVERDDARAEVERLTAERDRRLQPGPNRNQSTGETFIVPCTERQDRNAETTNPADVPPGEAWIVEVEGERRTALKDDDGLAPWNTADSNGRLLLGSNESVTPITRLVPAPRATLAAELRTASWGDIPALADRVEAVEKERDEARTKVEEVEGHLSKSWRQRDAKDVELERLSREREQQEKALVEHGRLLAEVRAAFDEVENRNLDLEADLRESHAEVERLTATFKEPLKEPGHLPDPADVPNGEAWVVRYKEEQCNGVKAYVGWAIADSYGLRTNIRNDEVTLVARLVPEVTA